MHTGKILSVNLTNLSWNILPLEKCIYDKFIGGRGLSGHLLGTYLENNPLIFCNGPLTGSGYQTSARCAVMHINPKTGGLFRSDFGGRFASALKNEGYDGLMITGRAESCISLVIDNGVRFADVPRGYATVSPGADRNIKYCKIISDGFFTSHRGGTGTMMHRMNLTAIGIRPSGAPQAPDTSAYEDIERLINAAPSLTGRLGIGKFGTAALYDLTRARDILPNTFFNLPQPAANTNACALGETQSVSCGGCTIACRKMKNGLRVPEYDEFAMLLCMGVPFERIIETYNHCMKQGIDIITACHCIAQSGMDPEEFLYDIPEEFYNGSDRFAVKGLNFRHSA